MNTIFQYGSGYPYTPFITNYEQQGEVLSNVLLRNSRRKASTFRMDIKFFKNIFLGNVNGKIYMNIFNLLDRRNQNYVYADCTRYYIALLAKLRNSGIRFFHRLGFYVVRLAGLLP